MKWGYVEYLLEITCVKKEEKNCLRVTNVRTFLKLLPLQSVREAQLSKWH